MAAMERYHIGLREHSTLLNKEDAEIFLQAILDGNFPWVAARISGHGWSTVKMWLEMGEAHLRSNEDTPMARLWLDFTICEARAEVALVKHWRKAAEFDWRAAKEFLERRFNGSSESGILKYANKDVRISGGGVDSQISLNVSSSLDNPLVAKAATDLIHALAAETVDIEVIDA